MPVKENIFGGTMTYRVRAYDAEMREITRSYDIAARLAELDPGIEAETIDVPPDDGIMELQTDSQVVFLQVEFVDLTGISPIGRCKIHRLDPRSQQIWPYVLSDYRDRPVNCGIELRVFEGPIDAMPSPMGSGILPAPPMATAVGPMGPPGTMPMGAPVPPPYETVLPMRPGGPSGTPPMGPPIASIMSGPLPPMMPLGAPGGGLFSAMEVPQPPSLVALLEVDSVKDMPYPQKRNAHLNQVMIALSADFDRGQAREIKRVGPFNVRPQGTRAEEKLAQADCAGTRVSVQAPLHFGGEARGGAMYIKVSVSYMSQTAKGTEVVGTTDPIMVSFDPLFKQYCELRMEGTSQVMGGVIVSHHLMPEKEVQRMGVDNAFAPADAHVPEIAPPKEIPFNVSGRTGNFPPFSPEEAMEQAAINSEAQNRALLQRRKMADPISEEDNGVVRTVGGYRQWSNLDALFASMGPNPLALSDDIGASVTRAYHDYTSVMKEIGPALGPNNTPVQNAVNMELVHQMYKDDPHKVQTALRPVICKDPDEIAATKDMRWLPDPPMYVPLKGLQPEDKETLRLACYEPWQSAKLQFADVNPNYQIREDIWGVQDYYRVANTTLYPKPWDHRPRRVKDECLMA